MFTQNRKHFLNTVKQTRNYFYLGFDEQNIPKTKTTRFHQYLHMLISQKLIYLFYGSFYSSIKVKSHFVWWGPHGSYICFRLYLNERI